MKKSIILLLVFAFALTLTGCGQGTTEVPPSPGPVEDLPSPEPDVVTVVDIIDRTETEPLLTADALEGFWYDEGYTYYFGSIKSHYVIVHYSDGTTQPVKEALAEGRITLADLDRFGIGYWKEPRIYVTDITDRDTMDTAVDVFFAGIDYYYYFPTIHETTVYYSDGTSQSLKEAMAELRVTVEDLDRFGIDYSKAPLKEIETLRYVAGELNYPGRFWSDLVYDYFFPCTDTRVDITYTDGTKMDFAEALKLGFVCIDDLDRFGVSYERRPRVHIADIVMQGGYLFAHEVFWSDADHNYYFRTTGTCAQSIVYYEDGTQETLEEALSAGRVTLADLDRFGVEYYKYFVDRVADIVDLTETGEYVLDQAPERFWSDGECDYYFFCIKSAHVVVRYNNGCEEPVREALEGGRITISDLDRFGIAYGKQPAVTVTNIEFQAGMDAATELFWSDEHYDYYFPSHPNTGTVYYSDGTSQTLTMALETGNADVTDLDRFGIFYTRRLRVVATFIRADSCDELAYEWLCKYASNWYDLNDSSAGSIPAVTIQMNTDRLEEFVQELDGYYQFHLSYDGQPSFLEHIGQYNWLWFQEHGLLVLGLRGENANDCRVVSLEVTEGEFTGKTLNIEVRRPEGAADDGADWFLLLELPREEMRYWSHFDARYVN